MAMTSMPHMRTCSTCTTASGEWFRWSLPTVLQRDTNTMRRECHRDRSAERWETKWSCNLCLGMLSGSWGIYGGCLNYGYSIAATAMHRKF
jgi:hypothetical protein